MRAMSSGRSIHSGNDDRPNPGCDGGDPAVLTEQPEEWMVAAKTSGAVQEQQRRSVAAFPEIE